MKPSNSMIFFAGPLALQMTLTALVLRNHFSEMIAFSLVASGVFYSLLSTSAIITGKARIRRHTPEGSKAKI